MSIPYEKIKAVNLYEYIYKYYPQVKLKRAGSVYQGLCPFPDHNEKTGSFTVFINTNKYKCFGCGEKGTIIDFVMNMEKLKQEDIKEVCELIGENVGIEVAVKPLNVHFEKYKDRYTKYADRYHEHLLLNKDAIDYLKVDRGFSDDIIEQFNIGLVPTDEHTRRSIAGEIYGRNIEDRISFPIYENKNYKSSKCVGMGYRSLDPNVKERKYINDKNQVGDEGSENIKPQDKNLAGVFIKGQFLYGMQIARDYIKKKDCCIIVEGYADVTALHQAGVKNTVGTMSTSLTKEHIDIIKKMTNNIIFMYDGDSAGVKNMLKMIPYLYTQGFNVMIVILSNNMDPADLCKKCNFNFNIITRYINNNSVQGMKILIDKQLSVYDNFVVKERTKALDNINKYLDCITNKATREVYENMTYKRLDMR